MRIEKALEELKKGKKITHPSWGKDQYIAYNDEQREVKFYILESQNFHVMPDTLLSEGWTEVGEEKEVSFIDALNLMMQGKRIINQLDGYECYYEMDALTRQIVRLRVVARDFTIPHANLLSPEWKVIE